MTIQELQDGLEWIKTTKLKPRLKELFVKYTNELIAYKLKQTR